MKYLIAASATLLLGLSQTAVAGGGRLEVAQADTGATGGTGTGNGSVQPNLSTVPSAPSAPGTGGGSNPALITPLPSTATQSAPPPQASAPSPSLTPPQFSGTQRNTVATTPKVLTPGTGPLPYGGTQSTVGVPSPVPIQPYGGTQRDSVGSVYGDLQTHGGAPSYGGTQATLGGPQNFGGAGQPGTTSDTGVYGAQPYGAQPYGTPQIGGTQRDSNLNALPPGTAPITGSNATGNGTVYSRAPVGSLPYTRDQTGVYGGVGSYDARGVYTGVSRQPLPFGQIYATQGGVSGVSGGTVRSAIDGTAVIRPYVPPIGGPGPLNSGYGIPNGSKPTSMDARGIQRSR